jgi:arsenite methyltransferase
MSTPASDFSAIKNYYGEVLSSSSDLKTSACCPTEAMPVYLRPLVLDIHEEIRDRFYGCGSPIPHALEGATVLDLGCGTGRDVYLISRLVGEKGRVIGVDMTAEQLSLARKHQAWHAERYGHAKSNVEFHEGFIEDLAAMGIADNSIDVVVSNCVLNLSPEKARVFKEIFRVLKPGGELYFSDVFADRRIPAGLRHDPVLLGECLSGAMYVEDFHRSLADIGCKDARIMSSSVLTVDDAELNAKIGMVGFTSKTVRAFKIDLEDKCEDFGQVAYYRGGIAESPTFFALDDHHIFEINKPMLVCGNTADMIKQSRFAKHFEVIGEKTTHYGIFDCAPTASSDSAANTNNGACC